MAKLFTMGDAIQIKTSVTERDFNKLEKYTPEALELVNENNEVYFRIDIGCPSISKYGVSFPNSDEEGRLFVTSTNPVCNHSDKIAEKNALIEHFALTMVNLKAVEAQVTEALKATEKLASEIEESIEML